MGYSKKLDVLLIIYYDVYCNSYISLGIPVPIVAISAGVAHDHYGHDEL